MRTPFPPASMSRQGGYMIIVVLVALVAMMLSGIALVRSMDTNQLMAGNLASRNATLHSADQGVQAAAAWLTANAGNPVLLADATANGYYAEEIEPPWTSAAFWATCANCTNGGPDAAGNTVSWVIHRMCKLAGSTSVAGNQCQTVTGGQGVGGSMSSDASTYTGTAAVYYRITVQVVDNRNTATLTQAFVSM